MAKRMERQRVLYDGEHHCEVILGEQAPYTNVHGSDRARYELVSTGLDITEPGELALYEKAFSALRSAAHYADAAKGLTSEALAS